jgi:hypothetical protein
VSRTRTPPDYAAKALASLDEFSSRELEATAEALRRRRKDPLRKFASVFDEVVSERKGFGAVGARFRLQQALEDLGEREAERLNEAEAPFWRFALQAREQLPLDDGE